MPNHRDMCKHAGVTAVSVSEWVNGYNAIVQSDRDLIRRIRFVLEPAANFVIELSEVGADSMRLYSNVRLIGRNSPAHFHTAPNISTCSRCE